MRFGISFEWIGCPKLSKTDVQGSGRLEAVSTTECFAECSKGKKILFLNVN